MKQSVLTYVFLSLSLFSQAQIDFESGLLGYWPFQTNMEDLSENDNHGNNVNCILTTDKDNAEDSAYEFDGMTSSIIIPSSYPELTMPFTVSAWVLKNQSNDFEHIFTSSSEIDNYHGIYLGLNTIGQMAITYGDGGIPGTQSRRSFTTTESIPDNVWFHVVAVVTAPDDMMIQIDSSPMVGNYSGTGSDTLSNGSGNAMIGLAAHHSDNWTGKIDRDCKILSGFRDFS